jgi:hypothetical protein
VTVDSEIKTGDLVKFSPSVMALMTEYEIKQTQGVGNLGLVIETFKETYGSSITEAQAVEYAIVLWPDGHITRDFIVHLRRAEDLSR